MYAITVLQPWAGAIAHLGKDVENRTWVPPSWVMGGRIAIHAGKKPPKKDEVSAFLSIVDRIPNLDPRLVAMVTECKALGQIVAVATIDRCINETTPDDERALSEWYFGPCGWVLRDVIALDNPVPCSGMQRFWKVPREVEAQVIAQYGPLDRMVYGPVSLGISHRGCRKR